MAGQRKAAYRIGQNVQIVSTGEYGSIVEKRSKHFTFEYSVYVTGKPNVWVAEPDLRRYKRPSRNDRFQQGSGVYTCEHCGKQTRETGSSESGVKLCRRCLNILEWANSVLDDGAELDEVPEDIRDEVKTEMGL